MMNNLYTIGLLIWLCFSCKTNYAQTTSASNFQIHSTNSGAGMAYYNKKDFGNNEIISNTNATVLFTTNSSWSNTYKNAYIEGFVSSKHNSFVFPVGKILNTDLFI